VYHYTIEVGGEMGMTMFCVAEDDGHAIDTIRAELVTIFGDATKVSLNIEEKVRAN